MKEEGESANKQAIYLWGVFLPFPTAEQPGGKLSAKLPRPCKHSGTSWGLESAESLPAGDLEMVRLKECLMSEGVGDRGCIYTEGVCRGQ